MTRPVRLTAEADARLDGVVDWTFERFGSRQADRYRAKFAVAFDRLAAGTLRGRSAEREWGEGVREGLLFVRVEKHVVLFLEEADEVVILDVLHEAMDLPGRIKK